MSSRCKKCGEAIAETGNYTFKVIPAKRVPKKARKLIKKGMVETATTHPSDLTSFQKFLLKRARPSNCLALTCGKCGVTSTTKMYKDNVWRRKEDVEINESSTATTTPEAPASKKRKRKKDKTAGLSINLKPTPVQGHSQSTSQNQSQGQRLDSVSTSKAQFPISITKKMQQGKVSGSSFQKQKDMDKLKKILFDSKKAKKSGSSLQDFLSSI